VGYFSEKSIQKALKRYVLKKSHWLFVPNIYIFGGWEMDFMSITKSDLITEYEIKISKSDYLNDFKKKKHLIFEKKLEYAGNLRKLEYRNLLGVLKNQRYPNYFYYVVPNHLEQEVKKTLPKYAGLIVVYESGSIRQVVRAKRLHTKKNVTKNLLKKVAISLAYRYDY
jgi:hypothetical protein